MEINDGWATTKPIPSLYADSRAVDVLKLFQPDISCDRSVGFYACGILSTRVIAAAEVSASQPTMQSAKEWRYPMSTFRSILPIKLVFLSYRLPKD